MQLFSRLLSWRKIIILLSLLASNVFAFTPVTYPAYVGLQVGETATHFAGFNSNGVYGARGLAGYSFTQNIGVEMSYTSYRNAISKSNTGYIQQRSYDFLSVWSLPLIDHFSTYAKVGMARMLATAKLNNGTVEGRTWRLAYGFGINYDISAHLVSSLEWYHVQGKAGTFDNGATMPLADFYAVGLAYRFGTGGGK